MTKQGMLVLCFHCIVDMSNTMLKIDVQFLVLKRSFAFNSH